MAPLSVETMETLLNLKRKIRRDKDAAPTQPIVGATNRYNKLQPGATYIHAGALPYPRGPEGYKKTIEHAGYTRSILARNPIRHNEFGDEIEDEDSDPEADADAQEENPYSGVHLEELLAPLRHPSELATHPSLSIPFTDSALPNMVKETEEKLRHERQMLANAQRLQEKLMGDESWMPSGRVETPEDWDLFEPRTRATEINGKRKRDAAVPVQNGDASHGQAAGSNRSIEARETEATNADITEPATAVQNRTESSEEHPTANDVDMQDADLPSDNAVKQPGLEGDTEDAQEKAKINGDADDIDSRNEPTTGDPDEDGSTPAPPPRRITRALAAENTTADDRSQRSPSAPVSTVSSSLLQPDPVYLLPSELSTSARFAALPLALETPADELLETRRLLGHYIQKQQETIRGFESILEKLYRAKHLRSKVWEACKAEGHVGEWSDGEDWIDAESWGEKEEDLKKGRDEDEAPEGQAEEEAPTRVQRGAKGKRRRGRGEKE
ncbi:uncharacterized protein HMPREF1541_07744 [Cyphellophora europaea CBS 101466]|uniref:Transcriptional regulatory protein RXT2 N-terminal domain-containing protein n=1 Tax=Cyphellophora europaea (strain CBS 101466) TaxID=1220924 RepID=W2RP70_CYPE1|nr:uncharacterized protein HMPREF1541_07744 [Cyphellophora europaea CBS 101466]ETN38120.1 hypothetical protein HMPREF1541_07744 [Cyphellophora europaea CBS 101466]